MTSIFNYTDKERKLFQDKYSPSDVEYEDNFDADFYYSLVFSLKRYSLYLYL